LYASDGAPGIEILDTYDNLVYQQPFVIHFKAWSLDGPNHNFGSVVTVLFDGGLLYSVGLGSQRSGCQSEYTVSIGMTPFCKHTIKLVGTANAGNGTSQYVESRTITVWADNPSTPEVEDMAHCTQTYCEVPQIGRPVNLVTGQMNHSMTDVRIDGPLPITFSRRYESGSSSNDFGMGYGWLHSYGMRLTDLGSETRKTLIDETQRHITFNCAGPDSTGNYCGRWEDDSTFRMQLGRQTDPPWRVTDKHGNEWDFDSSGRLTALRDRNNNEILLEYDGTPSRLTAIKNGFDRQLDLSYASDGHLETVSAGGRTITYGYDAGNLTTVTHSDRSSPFVTYTYWSAHRFHEAIDANDHVIESHTYEDGRVTATTSDDGNYSYGIDYDFPTISVTNGRSSAVTTTYTIDPRLGVATEVMGGPGCNSCGGSGNQMHKTYDDRLNLTQIIDGTDVRTKTTYDDMGNVVTRIEDSEGALERETTYAYTGTSCDGRFGLPCSISVPTTGEQTTALDDCADLHPNKVTSFERDAFGNVEIETVVGCNENEEFTRITSYEHDAHGRVTTIFGPRPSVADNTTHEYYPDEDEEESEDNLGRLKRVTDAAGNVTTYTDYDYFGNPRSVTDPNEVTTTYVYDFGDRVTEASIDGTEIVTEYQYDPVGNLETVRLPNCVSGTGCEFSYEYEYDEVNRLKEGHDGEGNVIEYSYDKEGNREREEYRIANGAAQRFSNFTYDDFNRLEYTYFNETPAPPASGATFSKRTYFEDGTVETEQDPLGHVTAFTYDHLKRLKTSTQMIGTEAFTTSYEYDSGDNLSKVTDPRGLETTYVNGDLGWRLSATSPDTGLTEYEYDVAGNLKRTTDANDVVVEREYDAMNRLTSISYPDSSLDVAYTYDSPDGFGKGRLTGMTDPSGETVYSYDERGLLLSEEKEVGHSTFVTGYEYDANGNLTEVRYPAVIPTVRQGKVNFTYDDDSDRVKLVTSDTLAGMVTIAEEFDYAPFGPRTAMTFGNTLVDARSYGSRYLPVNWTLGSLLSYTHSFNKGMDLTSLTDNLVSANSRSFGYDALSRLTNAAGPWGAGTACSGEQTYTYDKNGNRLCKSDSVTAEAAYSSTSNQIESYADGSNSFTYEHDANGSITGDTVRGYEYSEAQRLSGVGLGTATYLYDGHGRRVSKIGPQFNFNGETLYFYDPSGRLLTEMMLDGEGGGVGKDYLHLPDGPVARLDWWVPPCFQCTEPGCELIACIGPEERLNYYHNDHLGTPIAMTNQDAEFVWRAEYLPFGELFSNTIAEVENNLRFPGQYFDAETGLHQNWFRDYDPKTGRYMEADPSGIGTDQIVGTGRSTERSRLNLYAYTDLNPLRFVDPTGLAYFAKRALGKLPWLGILSCNSTDDEANTELAHEQLFFEDGRSPSNIGFFEDGSLKSESNPQGYRCGSGHFDDCVMREAVGKVGTPHPYSLPKYNCQHWADDVRARYRELEKDPQVKKRCECNANPSAP
jgi:RHS repeat-associated protein